MCIGLILSTSLFAQNDKRISAFKKSIEQEKKIDYSSAIETIYGLNDSTTYDVNLRLGWLCYKAGFKKKSLYYYEKAIQLAPNAIEPRYGFGYPAYLLEDFSALIEMDKKILEIDPNNKSVNTNLAYIYYYNKDYKNALVYFDKVVKLYPFDYDNNLMMGWSNLKLGNSLEAEQYFNVALLYYPKDISANEGISYIKRVAPNSEKLVSAFTKSYELSEKSDFKGAISAINSVYDAGSYYINLRLGWLSYLAGLQIESAKYYKIAAELKPQAVEPKLGSAIPTELLGNKNELKTIYESILSIDPQNTAAHYKLGLLDYSKKDYSSALVHFEKVVKLYPCDADALLMLGWANYQLGNMAESTTAFNRVLCLSPDNASALQGLAPKPAEQTKPQNGLKPIIGK
jgi:tetratricopeptide (TPR) repeat protein